MNLPPAIDFSAICRRRNIGERMSRVWWDIPPAISKARSSRHTRSVHRGSKIGPLDERVGTDANSCPNRQYHAALARSTCSYVRDLIPAIALRPAQRDDADAIVRLSTGPIAGKRDFIAESFNRRTVLVACSDALVVGYIVWDRAFFGRPFTWLLGVDPGFRRRGIGVRLLRAFVSSFPGEALFTSTNESNAAMRTLLARVGFLPSGRVENLDPGDPELFYFKPPVA